MFKAIIIWTLVIGILYRLLTRFILPIFRVTSAATGHVRQMQEHMRRMEQQMNNANAASNVNTSQSQPRVTVTKESSNNASDGDYIEYEEVK